MRILLIGFLLLVILSGCHQKNMNTSNVVFLHHSVGGRVFKGNPNRYLFKLFKRGEVEKWIRKYNIKSHKQINITQMNFPKKDPYGWKNYPFDYYNIWIAHGGKDAFLNEPTLEMLTAEYDIIIWKHCYPVANILPDTGEGNLNSEVKTLANYKLQYGALKDKMHSFGETRFIVWTPVPQVEAKTTEDEARRVREFYEWMIHSWDEKNDNIYLWDYYSLATEDGLYLKPENAQSADNAHPSKAFAGRVSEYFANRIIQVVNGIADESDITGK